MSRKAERLNSEIERLQARLMAYRRELAAARYKEACEQRRRESRRNIIVGEAVLRAIETGIWGIWQFNANGSAPQRRSLEQLLDAFVVREKDRGAMNLPVSSASELKSSNRE